MFEISTEDEHALVSFSLTGSVDVDETARLVDELRWALLRYEDRPIKLLADLRELKPTNSSVAELIQRMQQFAIETGVVRFAEITGSRHLAVQMAVVARRSGAVRVLRRFEEQSSAKEWLFAGDEPPSA